MEHVNVTITHKNEARQCSLRKGQGLQTLARHTDWIEFDCRKADCGICIVRVVEGMEQLSPPTAAEADFLRAMRAAPEERLACQCRAFGSVSIEVEDFHPPL